MTRVRVSRVKSAAAGQQRLLEVDMGNKKGSALIELAVAISIIARLTALKRSRPRYA
jgi:hypothetical protein